MNMVHFNKIKLMTIMTVLPFINGCIPEVEGEGDLQTALQIVELEGASSVRVKLKMRDGELKVSAGAQGLMKADFSYNDLRLKPKVKYDISGAHGYLRVAQPRIFGDINEWHLRLNKDVPSSSVRRIRYGRRCSQSP